MNRKMLYVAAAAAILAVVAGLVFVGGQRQPIPQPTATTFQASVLSTPQSTTAPGPPSVFHTERFLYPFSVTLGSGWQRSDPETPIGVGFGLPRLGFGISVTSAASIRIKPPGTEIVDYNKMAPWPDDIPAWLVAIGCTIDSQKTAQVGGLEAQIIDFTAPVLDTTNAGEGLVPRMTRYKTPDGFGTFAPPPGHNRFVSIRVGDGPGIVVVGGASSSTWREAFDAVDQLLATMTFD